MKNSQLFPIACIFFPIKKSKKKISSYLRQLPLMRIEDPSEKKNIFRINFAPIVMFNIIIFPNFDVKLIIFSQFWQSAFSQNCRIKPWTYTCIRFKHGRGSIKCWKHEHTCKKCPFLMAHRNIWTR